MNSVVNIRVKITLNVIIIGGLAVATACSRVGMKMNVYEAASTIKEVAVGLKIGPNLSRLLHHWELLDVIRPHTINFSALSIRRYADDSELAYLPLNGLEKEHGAPNCVAHRADLQDVLKTGAEMAGTRIHTDCKVKDINFENASIKILNCPNWIQGDVIIAADGIKSKIRKKMLSLHGKIDKIYASKDSGLIEALESPVALGWMAPDGHIMCYPIRNYTLLSTSLCTTNMQSM